MILYNLIYTVYLVSVFRQIIFHEEVFDFPWHALEKTICCISYAMIPLVDCKQILNDAIAP